MPAGVLQAGRRAAGVYSLPALRLLALRVDVPACVRVPRGELGPPWRDGVRVLRRGDVQERHGQRDVPVVPARHDLLPQRHALHRLLLRAGVRARRGRGVLPVRREHVQERVWERGVRGVQPGGVSRRGVSLRVYVAWGFDVLEDVHERTGGCGIHSRRRPIQRGQLRLPAALHAPRGGHQNRRENNRVCVRPRLDGRGRALRAVRQGADQKHGGRDAVPCVRGGQVLDEPRARGGPERGGLRVPPVPPLLLLGAHQRGGWMLLQRGLRERRGGLQHVPPWVREGGVGRGGLCAVSCAHVHDPPRDQAVRRVPGVFRHGVQLHLLCVRGWVYRDSGSVHSVRSREVQNSLGTAGVRGVPAGYVHGDCRRVGVHAVCGGGVPGPSGAGGVQELPGGGVDDGGRRCREGTMHVREGISRAKPHHLPFGRRLVRARVSLDSGRREWVVLHAHPKPDLRGQGECGLPRGEVLCTHPGTLDAAHDVM
mmetsp:Transcript_49290/g.117272  ORF Transcript_49290/g.117272 Transcript_49290/m.117272 type:complete len:482 (+) Transcript_49290:2314-3759(+)